MSACSGPNLVTSGLVFLADASDRTSYSPNVFPSALDIYNWTGSSGANSTLSRDTTTDPSPAGGIPLKMAQSANDSYTATYGSSPWNLAPALTGQTWTISVWVKASSPVTIEGPVIFEANSSGGYVQVSSAGSVSVGTTWTRVSYARTFTDATTAYIQVRLDGNNTGGVGVNVWWDGLQVERNSAATEFSPRPNTNNAVWYDISGYNNHLTIQNTSNVTFNAGGYLSTGSTGYFTKTSAAGVPTGNSQYCIGVWARQPSSWSGTSGAGGFISVGGFGTTSQSNSLRTLNNTAGQFHHYWWANDLSATSSSATLNTWFQVLAQFDGTTRSVWVNGVRVAFDTPSGHNVTTSDIQVSMTYPGEYQQGDIRSAFIYNRALTTGEITQNFYALRSKYGI